MVNLDKSFGKRNSVAKDHCVYHPETAAQWNCVGCGALLCQPCFPAAPDPARPPHCALCGGTMRHLGVANTLTPFWSRMPRFFLYPLALNGVLFLALLAALTILSARLFDLHSPLILLPVFIVGALVVRQGLRVIEFCGQGRPRPPGILELFDGNPTTLKMIGLMFAFAVVVRTLLHAGWLGIAGMVCVAALLPASIMLLAIHGSLRSALDPFQVIENLHFLEQDKILGGTPGGRWLTTCR